MDFDSDDDFLDSDDDCLPSLFDQNRPGSFTKAKVSQTTSDSATNGKYLFISEPDEDLKCLICLNIAEEPQQHGNCGSLFCAKCLNKHGRKRPCPKCRQQYPQYFQDGKSKYSIGIARSVQIAHRATLLNSICIPWVE